MFEVSISLPTLHEEDERRAPRDNLYNEFKENKIITYVNCFTKYSPGTKYESKLATIHFHEVEKNVIVCEVQIFCHLHDAICQKKEMSQM